MQMRHADPTQLLIGKLERSDSIPHFPHTRNAAFVGCKEILQAIDMRLQKESRVALHGIGGVGLVAIFLRTSVSGLISIEKPR